MLSFWGLIWSGLMWRPSRSILAIVTAAAPVALFYFMEVFQVGLVVENVDEAIFWTRPRRSLLTEQQVHDISQTTGVQVATGVVYVGIQSGRGDQFISLSGVDPETYLSVFQNIELPPRDLAEWRSNPIGALVDKDTAKLFGWKKGDHVQVVPLSGQLDPAYDGGLELDVAGVVGRTAGMSGILVHLEYIRRLDPNGFQIGSVYGRAIDTDQLPELSQRIDARLAPSSSPTFTAALDAYAKQNADEETSLRRLVAAIMLTSFISMVLVVAAPIDQGMQERRKTFAVLEAIGFSRWRILGLVLGEAVAIVMGGAILGLLSVQLLLLIVDPMQWLPPSVNIGKVALWIIAFSALTVISIAALPIWRLATSRAANCLRD